MSIGEVLYVKDMNVSASDDEEEVEEDIWDDRKLNEAYDKALKVANAEVARRVAMSTNSSQTKREGQDRSRGQKGRSTPKKNVQQSYEPKPPSWEPGMACRAVYDEDGLEYEAFILRIINDDECIVKFLGYENSEIVQVSTLKPSMGKEVQNFQIEQASREKEVISPHEVDTMELGSDRVASPGSTDRSSSRKKKNNQKKKKSSNNILNELDVPQFPFGMNSNFLRNMGGMGMPLPPPPPLTSFTSQEEAVEGDEHTLSSMLLSWYMSGYYTGLYQGYKKANRRNV